MWDTDFNKLSVDEFLKDMRKRPTRLDLTLFYGDCRDREAFRTIRVWLVANDFQ
jgi:hypothetical protein